MQMICLNPTFCNHLVHTMSCMHIKCVFSGPIPSISDQDIQGWWISTFDICMTICVNKRKFPLTSTNQMSCHGSHPQKLTST